MRGWFCLHLHPNRERQAQRRIQRDGYTAFLPMLRKWRKLNGRSARREEDRPLFPGYLFIECSLEKFPDLSAWARDGVESVLTKVGAWEPYPIEPDVIEAISSAQALGVFDETTAVLRLEPGDRVRIVKGPYAGWVGELARADGKARVKVLLDMLGAKRPAAIDIANVRVA